MKSLAEKVSQTLVVIAVLLPLTGGRAIYAFTRTKPELAFLESIGLALVCAALAFVANRAAKHFDQGGDSAGQ
jgi:hypothetical protein